MCKKIAIIPARGGSKRIDRKNIKFFHGKPIIAYSIETAFKSNLFDTVMVSTDDEEIAAIARKYGAVTPFIRSFENSGDYATTADVIYEVINEYINVDIHFDLGCCIYPTAPLLTPDTLIKGVDMLLSNDEADSLVPVVSFNYPPQRSLVIKNNYLEFLYPENSLKRSQDLPFLYHDCGQFYLFKIKKFLEKRMLLSDRTMPLIMKEKMVQDIDNEEDWQIAELKYTFLNSKG